MAWATPRTFATGDSVDDDMMNAQIKGNLDVLGTHTHTGAAGMGADTIGALNSITADDVSAPSTPSSGTIILYCESGVLKYKNSAGVVKIISLTGPAFNAD